jgi:hypothetical protein
MMYRNLVLSCVCIQENTIREIELTCSHRSRSTQTTWCVTTFVPYRCSCHAPLLSLPSTTLADWFQWTWGAPSIGSFRWTIEKTIFRLRLWYTKLAVVTSRAFAYLNYTENLIYVCIQNTESRVSTLMICNYFQIVHVVYKYFFTIHPRSPS